MLLPLLARRKTDEEIRAFATWFSESWKENLSSSARVSMREKLKLDARRGNRISRRQPELSYHRTNATRR